MAPKTPEPPHPSPVSHKMITAADGVPGEARTVSSDSYRHVPEPSPEESSRKEPPRIWPAARRQQSRTGHERHTTSRESPSGYGYAASATYGVMPPKTYGVPKIIQPTGRRRPSTAACRSPAEPPNRGPPSNRDLQRHLSERPLRPQRPLRDRGRRLDRGQTRRHPSRVVGTAA